MPSSTQRDRHRQGGFRAPGRRRPALAGLILAGLLLALSGCANPEVTRASQDSVTVRYGGMFATLDKATALAQTACGRYHRRARLRTVSFERYGGGERWAHFACLKN